MTTITHVLPFQFALGILQVTEIQIVLKTDV